MEYIRIKNTDLVVSRIAIGGDPMGLHAWGDTNEAEMIEAVRAGIDAGITYFDTADVYGLGTAEQLLAKGIGADRHKVVIATKFGVRRTEDNTRTFYDISPEWMRRAVEGSLRRLNTDYIDIYQIHYLDGITPLEDVVDALDRLKEEGKIRYYGLSNIGRNDLDTIRPFAGKFCSFQNQYSLACRDYETDIRQLADVMEMTPLTWGSLGQGILTGKYGRDVVMDPSDKRSRDTFPNFHGEKLQKNLDIVDEMRKMEPIYGKKPASIALRFILDYLPESAALVGVKRKSQVLSNCEAFGWKLRDEDLARLDRISR